MSPEPYTSAPTIAKSPRPVLVLALVIVIVIVSLQAISTPKLVFPLLLGGAAVALAVLRTKLFLALTLVGLTVHTLVFAHLLPTLFGLPQGVLGAWKEGAIALLLVITFARKVLSGEKLAGGAVNGWLLLYLALGAGYVFMAPELLVGLYGLRNGMAFFLLYFVGANLALSPAELRRLFALVVVSAVLVSAWGIFQPLVLGDQFLKDLRYGEDGVLGPSFYIAGFLFQRALSTFSSPNDLAAYLLLVMLVVLAVLQFETDASSRKRLHWALAFMVPCFLYTVSRSAYLGLFCGISVLAVCLSSRRLIKFLALFAVVALTIGWATGVMSHFVNTLLFRDPSVVGHLDSLLMSIRFTWENPFGIGLGMAGPKSGRFAEANFLNSESSYFIVMFQMGIAGILLLLAIYGSFLRLAWKTYRRCDNRFECGWVLGVFVAFLGIMTQYLFLPTIEELPVSGLLWFFAGTVAQIRSRGVHGA
ncbi:MAG: hypothetical protein IH614_05060 [Desulfuromonadales bacterium]|nr:hypothetical protein [Desulfuromonadales bacterium]